MESANRRMPVVEFRILGPLEVVRDGGVVPLHRPRLRALLAMLLLHANEVVSSDRLIDALWGNAPPQNAANALQTTVSRLRKQLLDGDAAGEVIRTRTPGYVIEVGPDDLDLARFERLVLQARQELRSGNAEVASSVLRDALSTWRGHALADLADDGFLQREIDRLEEERIVALELRIDADLACGRHAGLIGELEALVAEHPYRERLRGQLMLALYRSGRQAEALAAYQNGRRLLVDELGIEPSRALQELERSILRQEPSLDLPSDTVDRRRASGNEVAPAPAPPRWLVGRRPWFAAAVGLVATALAVAAVAMRDGGSGAALAGLAPNSLGAIDPETDRLVAQVTVGQRPIRVAVGENSVWVLNAVDRTVSRVDVSRREVVRTIPIPGVAEPAGLAAGDGAVWLGKGLYGPLYLSRISPSFNEIAQTVPLGRADDPFFAARWQVAVGEGSVWTVGGHFGTLRRLDPRTMRVVGTIDAGLKPNAVAVGLGAVWAAGSGHVVARVDPRTNAVVARFSVPRGPLAIAVGARAVWVTAAREDVVARIDPVTETITTVRTGDMPTALAVGHGSVWVANAGDGTVSRIDATTREVVATVRLGTSPEAIAVDDDLVWVVASTGLGER